MNGRYDREAMLDLVAAYALGVLPAAEHRLVTAFILEDSEARAEFAALRPAADAVGLIAEEPVDSARASRMKERLMATVRRDAAQPAIAPRGSRRRSAQPPRTGLGWSPVIAAAAAAAIALVSTIQNIGLRSDLANANARAVALRTQMAQNERVRARDRTAIDTMVADLVGADAQHYAVPQGDVVRHGARLYLALRTLPPLPKGKVYQAWTQGKGAKAMAPSVTFVPSAGGVAVVALPESAEGVAAVALSVEPEGGSRAPTSKPTFVRPLS